jgi:hypothetical protein
MGTGEVCAGEAGATGEWGRGRAAREVVEEECEREAVDLETGGSGRVRFGGTLVSLA